MSKRENTVENYLRDCIEELGGITRKWVSPGYSFVPDQIVMLNKHICFVEVKTTDGKLSSGQEREHTRLREQGFEVFTVYGKGGVDHFINNWAKKAFWNSNS